jgi:hypothetical protein
VFVDYSGKKIAIVDPTTGEVPDADIFVAVLGPSSERTGEKSLTGSPENGESRLFQTTSAAIRENSEECDEVRLVKGLSDQ